MFHHFIELMPRLSQSLLPLSLFPGGVLDTFMIVELLNLVYQDQRFFEISITAFEFFNFLILDMVSTPLFVPFHLVNTSKRSAYAD